MNGDSFRDAELRLREAVSSGDVRAIDEAVSEIMSRNDPESVGILLGALDDDAEYDSGMFSIIHAAESFPDPGYTQSVVSHLPHMIEFSPRWASIVLMRILNNDDSKKALIVEMARAQPAERSAVEWLCNKINEVHPSFFSKTTAVLLSTRL